MKSIRVLLFLVLISCLSIGPILAQDSSDHEVFDVVSLKKGGIIKGTILSFNEQTGIVVIEDTEGRKYTLGREEYDYIEENKVFPVKVKKERIIHERKTNQFEVSIGVETGLLNLNQSLVKDDYFLDVQSNYSNIPLSLSVNAGKYLHDRLYVGLASDIGVASYATSSFNIGGRVVSIQPSKSRNTAVYFPAEVFFSLMEFPANFDVLDTAEFNQSGMIQGEDIEVEAKTTSIGISVGAGLSFAMRNNKSFGIEASIFTHLGVNNEILSPLPQDPNTSFTINGFRIGLLYNL